MRSLQFLGSLVLIGGLSIVPPTSGSILAQQTSTQPATMNRLVGAVVSVEGQSLTVKPDSGPPTTVTVADSARVLETTPGAKTIAGATPIHLTDLAVGDRVLVAVRPAPDGSGPTATTVIAMRQADIAKEHQAEEADWQRRGLGGIVKSVDAAAGTIIITHLHRTVTVHTTPKTVIRLYEPGSIKFSETKLSTLDQIQSGDQLRVRGDRSADGSTMQADEIVAGSFRNIAGSVVSTNAAANTLTVRDFKTKKPVVIQVNADSQLHKLQLTMAQAIAARLKASPAGHTAKADGNKAGKPSAAGGSAQEISSSTPHAASSQSPAQPGAGRQGGNVTQMLQRSPTIQLTDLHHGDAVMIVATQVAPGSLTVCTLLAGVQPILDASAGQSLFSASWNLGGQGGGGAGGGETSGEQ